MSAKPPSMSSNRKPRQNVDFNGTLNQAVLNLINKCKGNGNEYHVITKTEYEKEQADKLAHKKVAAFSGDRIHLIVVDETDGSLVKTEWINQ